MAFPEQFIEDLKTRVSLKDVIGKKVKLTRRGKEWIGLCPFHKEKTPSFKVREDQDTYHCFGCGAHGNAITFVMKDYGLTFPEAIKYLAESIGMELPKESAESKELTEKRNQTLEIIEQTTLFYQQCLYSDQGAAAQSYLKNRGIRDETIEKFRLGYAPSGNTLKSHLLQNGFDIKDIVKSGVVRESDRPDAAPYDYFRNRVMFPIQDVRGKVIAFGGRVMDGGEPKYLNSSDSDFFHKGKILYALNHAKEKIYAKKEVVVVEGYMDVIALHQAGIDYAVAPLGTAMTEDHVLLLWKFVKEPLCCFDGDKAGIGAAFRVAERALPLLEPGYSLRFVTLKDGKDPDDLIKAKGSAFVEDLFKDYIPLIDLVWSGLMERERISTPERTAAFEKAVAETCQKIKNTAVRRYYEIELNKRLKALIFENRGFKGGAKAPSSFKGAFSGKKRIIPIKEGAEEADMLSSYMVLYPKAASKFVEDLETLSFEDSVKERDFKEILSFLKEEMFRDSDLFTAFLKEKEKPLPRGIAALKHKNRTEIDVEKDILLRLKLLHLQALKKEIEGFDANFRFTEEGNRLYRSMQDEYHRLSDEIEEDF